MDLVSARLCLFPVLGSPRDVWCAQMPSFRDKFLTYVIGDGLIQGLGLLLVPVYLAILPPAEYGVLACFGAAQLVAQSVLGQAWSSCVHRLPDLDDGPAVAAAARAVLMRMLVWSGCILMPALAIGFTGGLDHLFNEVPFFPVLAAALVSAWGASISAVPLAHLQATRRVVLHRTLGLGIAGASWLASCLAVAIPDHPTAVVLVAAQSCTACAAGLVVCCGWLWSQGRAPIRMPQPAGELQRVAGLTLYALVGNLGAVYGRWFLESAGSLADVAAYHVCWQLASILTLVMNSLNQAWLPEYSRMYSNLGPTHHETQARMRRFLAWGTLTSCVIMLLSVLVGPSVVSFLSNGQYRCSWTVLLPLLAGNLVGTLLWARIAYPQLMGGKTSYWWVHSLVGTLTSMLLMRLGYGSAGIPGLALGHLAGQIAMVMSACLLPIGRFRS